MSEFKVYKSAEGFADWNRTNESLLDNMDHLNELLRKQTQENLFLGTRNFD
jgi:hypothetical protein